MKKHFTTLELPHGDPLIGAKVRLVWEPDREGVIIASHPKLGYEVKWLTRRAGMVGLYLLGELEVLP